MVLNGSVESSILQPTHSKYIALEDGRRLCSECNETAVMDTKDCQPLFKEILKFYKNLGMNIEQQIPMLLVEREALNNAREVEKDVSCHSPFFVFAVCFLTPFI